MSNKNLEKAVKELNIASPINPKINIKDFPKDKIAKIPKVSKSSKVQVMFKILAENGINAEALEEAMRLFKYKYPRIKKTHVVYYYMGALHSAQNLGMQAFMKREKLYPCPFDNVNSGKRYKCRKGNTCKSMCMGMAY